MGNIFMSVSHVPPPVPQASGVSQRMRFGRVILALMLREMSSRYGRSPGGYVWALLEPVGMIAVMSLGFSLLVRTPPLGTSFILFFATGFIPFSLYQNLSNSVARSIRFSRALLTYPIIGWLDALVARFLLNSLTGIMVGYVILLAVVPISDSPVAIELVPILETLVLAMGMGFAVGIINCALTGLINIWDQVWSIASRPLFLASGVIFLYDSMPQAAQNVLWYNPLLHIVGIMRTGFFPTYEAPYVSVPYVVAWILILTFMGVVLMGRYHRRILSE